MRKILATLAAVLFAASASAANRTVVSYGPSNPIPAAGTVLFTDPFIGIGFGEIDYIAFQMFFDVTTAGGTSLDAYLQTSVDDGTTWQDVCNLQVTGVLADVEKLASVSKNVASTVRTAASDGALAANTCANGFFGTKWRVKLVIVGPFNADNLYRLHVDWQKVR